MGTMQCSAEVPLQNEPQAGSSSEVQEDPETKAVTPEYFKKCADEYATSDDEEDPVKIARLKELTVEVDVHAELDSTPPRSTSDASTSEPATESTPNSKRPRAPDQRELYEISPIPHDLDWATLSKKLYETSTKVPEKRSPLGVRSRLRSSAQPMTNSNANRFYQSRAHFGRTYNRNSKPMVSVPEVMRDEPGEVVQRTPYPKRKASTGTDESSDSIETGESNYKRRSIASESDSISYSSAKSETPEQTNPWNTFDEIAQGKTYHMGQEIDSPASHYPKVAYHKRYSRYSAETSVADDLAMSGSDSS